MYMKKGEKTFKKNPNDSRFFLIETDNVERINFILQ